MIKSQGPVTEWLSLFGLNCNRYTTGEAAKPHLQQNLMSMSCQSN